MADVDFSVLLRSTRKDLEMLYLHLKTVQAGICCASLALRQQHCEQDIEVARVLDHFVGASLSRQLERTREMISSLQLCPASSHDLECVGIH